MMTQLKYLATTLLLIVGCTTEVPASDPASGIDDTATSEPDQAGATDGTAPNTSWGDVNRSDDQDRPEQGESCPNNVCAAGLTCLEYYGFGGAAGGLIKTCEIPCGAADQCPEGQACTMVYDGPGQVCQPNRS